MSSPKMTRMLGLPAGCAWALRTEGAVASAAVAAASAVPPSSTLRRLIGWSVSEAGAALLRSLSSLRIVLLLDTSNPWFGLNQTRKRGAGAKPPLQLRNSNIRARRGAAGQPPKHHDDDASATAAGRRAISRPCNKGECESTRARATSRTFAGALLQ